MIHEYLRLIFKDIRFRKFSSFLTLFAITLGIMSIDVIILLGDGFEASVAEQFEKIGSNRIYISGTDAAATGVGGKGLSDDEISFIATKPYIDSASAFYMKLGQLKYGTDFATQFLIGMTLTQQGFEEYNLKMKSGRYPKANEKYAVVMGSLAASEMFDREVPVGANLYVKDTKFKLIGILEEVGNPQDDSQIYFNIDTIREIFDEHDKVNIIQAIIVPGYDVQLARDNLKIALDNKLGKEKVIVRTQDQFLENFQSILGVIKYTLSGIALVALIVGALGIINTMYVIVTEKVKEIGIMKSVGARNEDILLLFMFQAGLFGLLGAFLGVIFGSILTVLFEYWAAQNGFTMLKVSISPFVTIALLVFGFLIGILSGYLPAYRASKLNVVDALRK